MSPWLRVVEAYLVQALLRTPAFHRGVEKVVRAVYRVRYGPPPEEMGGSRIDSPREAGFTKHFVDEVKTQIGAAERQEAASAARPRPAARAVEEETSDAAWENAQKNASQPARQSFLAEYMSALREQVRNNAKTGR